MREKKNKGFAESARLQYNNMSTLYKQYEKEGKSKLAQELKVKNLMALPRLLKIVVNIGLGEALLNKKVIESATEQLALICGQKPVITRARKDISSFKLRKGEIVGLKATLRGKRMYDFFEKLVKIVLPRLRDFRGVSERGFDGRGGFTLGFPEQIVFPEIEYSKIDKIRGLEVTFVTSGKNKEETKKLLEVLGMPFRK